MNIAIFTDTYPPYINGVATSTFNLVKVLKQHGHRVIVVTARYNDGPLEMIDDIIYMPGIPIKKMYGYRLTAFYSSTIFNYLQEFNTEVIHIQADASVSQFGKIVARQLHVPIVYTYHTQYEDYTYYLTGGGIIDRFAKRVMRWYTRQVAKLTAGFISPSNKTKDYLRQIKTDVHINIIPTGIDFTIFDKKLFDVNKAEEFRKQHNIPNESKIFLLLGRVGKEKSMDVSIKYFAEFTKVHPEFKSKLVVVGGGPQLDELKVLTSELNLDNDVFFIGPVSASEVPFYYHLADVYTSASLTETQGLTFMESMASETIVLAKFDDQLSGTIINGETGFFYTDVTSFIERAYKILTLEPEEINKLNENVKKILEIYTIEKFYENVIKVYEKAIKKFW